MITGKGGQTIKDLQERVNCKMVLKQDGIYADAPEKLMCITGAASAVEYGKQLVQDMLVSKVK